MKLDGFILDFTGLSERPCLRYNNGGKISLHARRTTTFYTFCILKSCRSKVILSEVTLMYSGYSTSTRKMHLHYLSQLLNCVSNPPPAPLWNCPRVWFGRRYNPTKHISPILYHSFCDVCDLLLVKSCDSIWHIHF